MYHSKSSTTTLVNDTLPICNLDANQNSSKTDTSFQSWEEIETPTINEAPEKKKHLPSKEKKQTPLQSTEPRKEVSDNINQEIEMADSFYYTYQC